MASLWTCPHCGRGARAPQRLRRDDVRRYCLGCSKQTGRLVERGTAAAARRKVKGREKAARTRKRNAEARERERLRRETVVSSSGRINVVKQTERWSEKLPALVSRGGFRAHPQVQLRHRSDGACSGRAGSWRVVLSIGDGASLASIYGLILHELAHTVANDVHGKQWRAIYIKAVRQAFPGIKLSRSLKGTSWDLWARVHAAITDHLANGGRVRWKVAS